MANVTKAWLALSSPAASERTLVAATYYMWTEDEWIYVAGDFKTKSGQSNWASLIIYTLGWIKLNHNPVKYGKRYSAIYLPSYTFQILGMCSSFSVWVTHQKWSTLWTPFPWNGSFPTPIGGLMQMPELRSIARAASKSSVFPYQIPHNWNLNFTLTAPIICFPRSVILMVNYWQQKLPVLYYCLGNLPYITVPKFHSALLWKTV